MAEPAKEGTQEGLLRFGGFSEDRLRIDRIIERLDVTDDLIERADLGRELVRAVSRDEDTIERTLRPRLVGSGSGHPRDALDRDASERPGPPRTTVGRFPWPRPTTLARTR
jgi:hypothetical protein